MSTWRTHYESATNVLWQFKMCPRVVRGCPRSTVRIQTVLQSCEFSTTVLQKWNMFHLAQRCTRVGASNTMYSWCTRRRDRSGWRRMTKQGSRPRDRKTGLQKSLTLSKEVWKILYNIITKLWHCHIQCCKGKRKPFYEIQLFVVSWQMR